MWTTRSYHGAGGRRHVAETLAKITAPVRRRGIPFAVTFGNHDTQAGLNREAQAALYTRLPGCLMPQNGPDPGTFQLRVRSADGARDALAIYLADSGDGLRGKYFPAQPHQTLWLQNAVYGIGRRSGCLALNRQLCRPGGVLAEAPGTPEENSGPFEALRQTDGIFAMFFGHDHRNTFSGRVDGIELGYTPSCGFDAYGAGVDRGGRLFVFRQKDPAAFATHVFTYRQLVGRRPVKLNRIIKGRATG